MSEAPSSPSSIPAPDPTLRPPAEPLGALYSSRQIAVATFLGSPLAGAVLWRANLARVGGTGLWRPIAVGVGILATLVGIATLLPRLPAGPVNIGLAMGALQAARARFPDALVASAGRRSWWTAIGVSLAVVVPLALVVVGTAVAAESLAPGSLSPHVRHGENEMVYLDDDVTEADGERVARGLAAAGYFTGSSGGSFTLESVRPVTRIAAELTDGGGVDEQRAWAETLAHDLANALGVCVTARTSRGVLGETTVARAAACPEEKARPEAAAPTE